MAMLKRQRRKCAHGMIKGESEQMCSKEVEVGGEGLKGNWRRKKSTTRWERR